MNASNHHRTSDGDDKFDFIDPRVFESVDFDNSLSMVDMFQSQEDNVYKIDEVSDS